jgi:hypothetical protein
VFRFKLTLCGAFISVVAPKLSLVCNLLLISHVPTSYHCPTHTCPPFRKPGLTSMCLPTVGRTVILARYTSLKSALPHLRWGSCDKERLMKPFRDRSWQA